MYLETKSFVGYLWFESASGRNMRVYHIVVEENQIKKYPWEMEE